MSQIETFHTPEFTTDCYDTIIAELNEKANTTEFAPESARRYLELLEIQKEIITKINDMHGMHYDNFVVYRIVIRIDSEVWNRDRSGIMYRDMNPNEKESFRFIRKNMELFHINEDDFKIKLDKIVERGKYYFLMFYSKE